MRCLPGSAFGIRCGSGTVLSNRVLRKVRSIPARHGVIAGFLPLLMMTMTNCMICGEGHLTTRTGVQDVEYRGHHGDIPYHYLACDTCGSETAGDVELRENKRAMTDFKRSVDGLLTGAEIRNVRLRHQLTQVQAANLFGGGPVAFSKYEAGDVTQSGAMDKLLRVFDLSGDARQLIEQMSICTSQHYLSVQTAFEKVGKVTIIHLKPSGWTKAAHVHDTHFRSLERDDGTVFLSQDGSSPVEPLIVAG